MVSHSADCLGAYARRLLVLEDGQLVRDGTPEGIYADLDWMRAHRLGVPQSRTAAALLRRTYNKYFLHKFILYVTRISTVKHVFCHTVLSVQSAKSA